MSSWRDAILKEFVPHVSKLTLVADPDSLLTEEKLALELRDHGFEFIEFNDSIEFRYAYESKYRTMRDRGEDTDLVVIYRQQEAELKSLPYDLLQAGRKLSFNLGKLFPNLSYPVVEKIDRSSLDALYDAQRKKHPDPMGDNTTKDFILSYVFGIAAEVVLNDVELLKALLRIHYRKSQIPAMLAERLVEVFGEHGAFKTWPLDEIVPDSEAFFAFLQERWPVFLSRLRNSERVKESPFEYHPKYAGPDLLPLGHEDIRVYIDNLFVEGKLVPVHSPEVDVSSFSWVRSGIAPAPAGGDEVRISRLFELVEKKPPTIEAAYSDWTDFAMKWAELSSLVHRGGKTSHQIRLQDLGAALNTTFAAWLRQHYGSLISAPPTNPVMVHHVARRLARDLEEQRNARIALIVVDGLALDQWVTVRQRLQEQDDNLVVREGAVFAWIPTVTSVSRQSIFSGKPPLYFPNSIYSTNNDEKLWKQFWEDHGLSRLDIVYQRGLRGGDAVSILDAAIHPGKTKVVGLVVDKIDKIMHGMELGAAGMHNQILQWCQGGFLSALIGYLLDHDYQVWLTSDHGSTECYGIGCPAEGVIAEARGERVRVYPTPELRSQVASRFPSAVEWEPVGIPAGFFPLVAGGDDAFIKEGEMIVGHGGCSIQEVIVPLVKFERKLR